MMKIYILMLTGILTMLACTRENEDLVEPVLSENFPQVILFDDEGGGELEDSDEFSVVMTLADRFDASGEELSGKIEPLVEDVILNFSIEDVEGIEKLSDFILGAEAFYEVDECTTSLDEGNDLLITLDKANGTGQLTFPADVEEVELSFQLDDTYLADNQLNKLRGFKVKLSAEPQHNLQVLDAPYEYEVLDDEAVFGKWVLDLDRSTNLQDFQSLLSLIKPEINALTVEQIEEVKAEFSDEELKFEIMLSETRQFNKCGENVVEQLLIEVETEYAELSRDSLDGKLEVEGSVDFENGAKEDFVYAGSFIKTNDELHLTLIGEFMDAETEELTLYFKR